MRKTIPALGFLLLPFLTLGQDMLRLAPPIIHVDSCLFQENATVSLEFGMEEAKIEYLFLGISDRPKQAKAYETEVVVEDLGVFWARSTASGFRPSEWRRQLIQKQGIQMAGCKLLTPASAKYPGNGGQDLFDGRGGTAAFNSKGWLGFGDSCVVAELAIKGEELESISISYLFDPGSWILGPEKLELVGSRKGKRTVLHEQQVNWAFDSGSGQRCEVVKLTKLTRRKRRQMNKMEFIRLEMQNSVLPQGHPGAGSKAWIFLDEIILR